MTWETKTEEAAKQKSRRKRLRSSLPQGATRVSPHTSSQQSLIRKNQQPVRSRPSDFAVFRRLQLLSQFLALFKFASTTVPSLYVRLALPRTSALGAYIPLGGCQTLCVCCGFVSPA